MKKVGLVVIIFCLMLGVTACGNKNKETDTETGYLASVTLGKYKELEVERVLEEITDNKVMAVIYDSLYTAEAGTEVTAREDVKLYDCVNLDYTGKKDGVAFSGGSATGAELIIGSNSFIPGFEEGLIGAKIGDTTTLNISFPENYGNAELAGQPVTFEVKINSVKTIENLSNELVAANSEYKTLEEYKTGVRASLEASAKSVSDSNFNTAVTSLAVDNAEFKKDLTTEIQEYADYMYSYYEYQAQNYGMDLATYIYYMTYGTVTDLEVFKAQLLKSAEYTVKREYVVMAVAEKEKLSVSDDEYAAGCDDLMRQYEYETVDALLAEYGEKAIKDSLLYDKALNLILESAIEK